MFVYNHYLLMPPLDRVSIEHHFRRSHSKFISSSYPFVVYSFPKPTIVGEARDSDKGITEYLDRVSGLESLLYEQEKIVIFWEELNFVNFKEYVCHGLNLEVFYSDALCTHIMYVTYRLVYVHLMGIEETLPVQLVYCTYLRGPYWLDSRLDIYYSYMLVVLTHHLESSSSRKHAR